MKSQGLSEVLSLVLVLGIVLVLSAIFVLIAGFNFASASASTSLAQAQTFFVDVAQDLNAAIMNGVQNYALSFPRPTTQFGVYGALPNYCKLIVVNTTHAVVDTYSSGAILFGVSPSYLSLPSGFSESLFSNCGSLIFNSVSSSFFAVCKFGAGNLNGVSYGAYLVLFPRVGVFSSGSTYYIYVPIMNVIFDSSLRGLFFANVTSWSYTTINNPLYITYSCGSVTSSYSLNGASKIEIVLIKIIIKYG
ncbi:MAG: hypothetical protein ACP5L5_09655 [Vulcanisaeta sp.]|uniref:hypothetical protein n=1 Tax=Vulcanisaeta sp. TaxID=2020871 RepID=UPI003D1402C4